MVTKECCRQKSGVDLPCGSKVNNDSSKEMNRVLSSISAWDMWIC